uniref:Exonuclease domain-containing protein n=1 Tax=Triticum urartu TaxID=4572 RepID=A0A8R7PFP2_TRIUA
MANLANMFAVLDLDGEDDRKEVEQPTSSKPEAAAAAAPRKPDSGMMNNKMIVNYDGDKLGSLSSEYKMPLVWIDLEMTGLDIRKDRILEIACIITDGKLTKRIEGPDLVIRQSKECLDNMNEWCKTHHGASGLTEQVLQSDISECDAEKQATPCRVTRLSNLSCQ